MDQIIRKYHSEAIILNRCSDLCEKHHSTAKDTCAFGDGGNDIEMLKAAGLGIAMGNGGQELKDAADYVAHDISNDGLYKALKHFGFVEEIE